MSSVSRKLRLIAVASLIVSGAVVLGPTVPAAAQAQIPKIDHVNFLLDRADGYIDVYVYGAGFGESPTVPFYGDSRYFIFEDITNNWSAGNQAATNFANHFVFGNYRRWDDEFVNVRFRTTAGEGLPWEPRDQVRIGLGNPQYSGPTVDQAAGQSTTTGESPTSAWWEGTLGSAVPAGPGQKPVINAVTYRLVPRYKVIEVFVDGTGFGQYPGPVPFYDNSRYFIFEDTTNIWSAGNVVSNDYIHGYYAVWDDSRVVVYFNTYGWPWKSGDRVKIGLGNPQYSGDTVDPYAGHSTMPDPEKKGKSDWWQGTLAGPKDTTVGSLGTIFNGCLADPPMIGGTLPAGSTDITGWVVARGNSPIGKGSVDALPEPPVLGSYWQAPPGCTWSVDLAGTSPGAVSQWVKTVPGHSYILRWAMAGNPEKGPKTKWMAVLWDGNLVKDYDFDTDGHTLSSMGWELEAHKVTATGAISVVGFEDDTPGAKDYGGAALGAVSLTGPGA